MSSTGNQSNKKNEYYAKNDFYSLNKVIGLGTKNNYSFSINTINGLTAWACGPYVIFYDLSCDKQISFLKNINNKIISCIKFSQNGKYLATGEGNCRNGAVCIYQINYNNNSNEESHILILENKIHKYGIDKLLFIKKDRYILSIGNNDDKLMNIMDIQNRQNIFTSRFNRPILCSEVSDTFMILGGNGFIKLYKYNKLLNASLEEINNSNLMEKYLVDLAKLKGNAFVSAVIYDYPNENDEKKIFFMTYDGYLVEMKSSTPQLNRWVHLKAKKGITLTLWDNMIGCGLSDGLYRVFNADNLSHIITLQRPPPLGTLNSDYNNKKGNISIPDGSKPIFADVMATSYNNYYKKLIVIYSDKTFFVWDINDLKKCFIYRYNIFQNGGINAMDYSVSKKDNLIKIATCSDDDMVIYWNFKLDEFINNPLSSQKNQHIFYSKYIRHIFYFCKNYSRFKVNSNDIILNKNIIDDNLNENDSSLTSIKFSPDAFYLLIGDSIGNINIFSLITFEQVIVIPTHSGFINSIDMIKDFDKNESFLSTGSADTFITVFDISKGFSKDFDDENNNIILEKMNSSVINVALCLDKNKNLKLVTAEQDSTITFFLVNNSNKILQTLQKFHDDKLKTYCLNYSRATQKIISGHNGKISIWKTSSNTLYKHFQVNKGDKLLDNFRIASDSNGVMFATSNNDKIIRIRAFHDGKLLCKIPVSESISSLGFILDDNYLIATSVEGYIYFYELNQDLIKTLQKNNDLINSTEEKKVINNKLKLLQKFMENDASLSKNDQVKNLLDKFQRSEETTIDDLKILNVFVKEGKKKYQDINEENKIKKSKEIIELKEDKPNNNDDLENENNDEGTKNNLNNNILLNKSKIFEKELRENNVILSRNNIGRISLTDTYKSNNGLFHKKFPKIKIVNKETKNTENQSPIHENNDINKETKNIENQSINQENYSNTKEKKEDIINPKNLDNEDNHVNEGHLIKDNYDNDKIETNDNQNDKKEDISKSQLKILELRELINNTNNIINNVDSKINQETSKVSDKQNKEKSNEEGKDISASNNDDINDILNIEDIKLEKKEEEKELVNNSNTNLNEQNEQDTLEKDQLIELNNINSIQSSFKEKIYENSQSHISQKYQYLTMTQTTLGINSLMVKKYMDNLIAFKANEICILKNPIKKNKMILKQNDFIIQNISKTDKEKLKNELQSIKIDDIKDKNILKKLENKLELLMNKIREKLGYQSEKQNLENILEKYSALLLNKIEKLNKNK